jgi:hypothetical protein
MKRDGRTHNMQWVGVTWAGGGMGGVCGGYPRGWGGGETGRGGGPRGGGGADDYSAYCCLVFSNDWGTGFCSTPTCTTHTGMSVRTLS